MPGASGELRDRGLHFLRALALGVTAIIILSSCDPSDTGNPKVRPYGSSALQWPAQILIDFPRGPRECSGDIPPADAAVGLGCRDVSIECDSSAKNLSRDMGGFCGAVRCNLSLPASTCADFSLQSGKMAVVDLENAMQAAQAPTEFDSLWDRCRLIHEVQHLRDGALRPLCSFELRGTIPQLACLEKYGGPLCKDPRSEGCLHVRQASCRVKAAQQLLVCACAAGGDQQGCSPCLLPCREAYAKCLDEKEIPVSAEGICSSLEANYCRLTGESGSKTTGWQGR